jgi:ATP-binding cassette, subfamily B, bacterial MsbA
MFRAFRTTTRKTSPDEPFVPPSAAQIQRLLRYLLPYKGWLLIAVVSLLFGSSMGLLFPWIMQGLVDAVITQRDFDMLNSITGWLILAFLARSVFYYFQGYALTYVGERVLLDLRRETYTHIHRLSVRFFADRRTGELISRLSSDVSLVRGAVTGNLVNALGQLFTFIGSIILMLVLNWRLTLFVVALAPVVVISAAIFGRYLRQLSTDIQDKIAESLSMAEQAIGGIRVVKAFVREP